jgi:chromosome segregation protein
MHIKKIEIAGFKSFVDRTVIHFDHDVVGIVGPNGCGKSNIVDAIRWCMGEQSVKHLRGRSMEDVIFNGSESRGPHGLADVTITFDNTDFEYSRDLPPEYRDYPEIAVSRRLFRDGTSEYLINKTQVRLRDVTDLFLGTGVGTKAYSIVEQGRIGQIVSARAEDRRLFIEEAAGITKYKQRRKQAERKMELTRQNLLRVSDIVTEIDRNRASLKRQVAKAERYLAYRAELEDLALHEASHKLLELTVLERVEREGLDAARTQAEAFRARLTEAEAELDAARARAAKIEGQNDEAARRAFEADNDVATLVAEIERSHDRLGHLAERLGTDEAEQREISARMAELSAERAELEARIELLSADQQARVADAEAEEETLGALRRDEAEALEHVQAVGRRSTEAAAEAAAATARIDGLRQRVADLHARRDRTEAERESVAGELLSADGKRHALEQSVAQLAEGKRLTFAEREALDQEMHALRGRQLDSERAVDAVKNELGLKRNRLRALEELHRRLEGVGAGTRALLSQADPAVLGMIADRIEAPAELTAAFAGLLGERLQYVVVSDTRRGLELLGELRDAERGRAHIVPLRPSHVAGPSRGVEDPRALGRLADRLQYAPEDAPLVRALIGDAWLVATASDALALVERSAGVTAVALDGTVVRPDGVISGGSGDDVASDMVEQKREMRALAAEVERLDADQARLVGDHNQLRARMAELGTALDRARQDAHEGELAHVTAEKDLARTASESEHSLARQSQLEHEIEEIDRALAEADDTEAQAQNKLAELEHELELGRHALGKAQERAVSWKERVEAQAALVTERKVRLAQVREQADAASSAHERLSASLADLETRSERLAAELHDAAASYGDTAARIMLARAARIDAQGVVEQAHASLADARAALENVRQALGTSEAELRELRAELNQLDARVQQHEMALQRIELEREHLLSDVRQRFRGLHLPRVVGDYHARPAPDAEHSRRIQELTQLIDRMGPVNLDAAAEFQDAERRFHELNDQKTDIEKALEELERAIKHMDRESRRRFKEAFEAVNLLFKKTFGHLFRGGRAELKLTDPDDLLGTGVDIIAQPPGKKLTNIELLSGGEKALTAVSLIFAIFQHRPSPFCVLDEVDAPLDEANVARYTDAIRGMTDRSQFILITHLRQTMQKVDVLYGVTMGEPGVSRIVSVKVNDEAGLRSDSRQALNESGAPPAVQSTQVA